jgi:hypothetical protein
MTDQGAMVSTTPTTALRDAVVTSHANDNDDDDDGLHHKDVTAACVWAGRQLASPVRLHSLRAVYDALVERLMEDLKQQNLDHASTLTTRIMIIRRRLMRLLHLTCRLLLEIHRDKLNISSSGSGGSSIGGLLSASQQSRIETTAKRCRWLLDHDSTQANATAIVGHDNQEKIHQDAAADNDDDADGTNSQDADVAITNLCRSSVSVSSSPAAADSATASNACRWEWTYELVVASESDHDGGDEDMGDDANIGSILPSRAELAAEEEMLWRMAETPIPPHHEHEHEHGLA